MYAYKPSLFDKRPALRYFSAFSGIGGAELAIKKLFNDSICVGYSEIDQDAIKIYQKHHVRHENYGDINQIDPEMLPEFDLLIGGSLCQPFSLQNTNRKGFNDPRSDSFKGFVNLLKKCDPRYFLFENVMMQEEERNEITRQLGVPLVILNSQHFSAQNRKRLYWANFRIPQPPYAPSPNLEDVIDKTFKGTAPMKFRGLLKTSAPVDRICAINRVKETNEIRFRDDHKAHTVVGSLCYKTIVAVNGIYRHLSPIEREQLQGFPINYTAGVPASARERLIANAFQVDTICYVLRQM
ncbi:DNA (cytosine-5-)-methyltransferase [Powellomyces hirtus]|uniref:DNA (Cytosine-5-)-methyltransferase n=1 Tax=Powellomyces hirtus TaxID=109895 RepID=A0A507DQR3_9FUNG|nr:DNA (cytosine-5-)-methyltransferase [Powellomyces hirtus]